MMNACIWHFKIELTVTFWPILHLFLVFTSVNTCPDGYHNRSRRIYIPGYHCLFFNNTHIIVKKLFWIKHLLSLKSIFLLLKNSFFKAKREKFLKRICWRSFFFYTTFWMAFLSMSSYSWKIKNRHLKVKFNLLC